jgi:hypothetical protein
VHTKTSSFGSHADNSLLLLSSGRLIFITDVIGKTGAAFAPPLQHTETSEEYRHVYHETYDGRSHLSSLPEDVQSQISPGQNRMGDILFEVLRGCLSANSSGRRI